jgi:hypothetical protein
VGKALSNKQIVRKAIEYVCLAGAVNKPAQEDALRKLSDSDAQHFVVVLRDANSMKFRGLYSFDFDKNVVSQCALHLACHHAISEPALFEKPDDDCDTFFQGSRLYGSGPSTFAPDQILALFKYSSAAKEFQSLSSSSFSVRADAVTLPWKPKDRSSAL